MSDIVKSHCNKCLGERNHEILFARSEDWADKELEIHGENVYELLKCCGCDQVSLRHKTYHSEWTGADGRMTPAICHYPPAMFRRIPRWLHELRKKNETKHIYILLWEIYIGLQNSLPCLATMGIRAVIEHIMIAKIGDHGSFMANLAEFSKKGFISSTQADILKTVLEVGHATTHRAYKPSTDELTTCLDIAESLIDNIFIQPVMARDLQKRIPKRE